MEIKNCVGQTPFDVADPDVLRFVTRPVLSQPVLSSCPILSHDNFLLSCFTKNKNLDSLIFDD